MQVDPQLPHNTPDAVTFWDFIKSLLPVGLLASFVGILYHIRDVLKERTWKSKLAVLLVYASTSAAIGPIAMVYAHEAFPEHSHMAHMMAGCAVGAICPQLIVGGIRRRLGLTSVNLSDPNDIDSYRQGMSPEERARHADACPFAPDRCGGACMQCPHRLQHMEKHDA